MTHHLDHGTQMTHHMANTVNLGIPSTVIEFILPPASVVKKNGINPICVSVSLSVNRHTNMVELEYRMQKMKQLDVDVSPPASIMNLY